MENGVTAIKIEFACETADKIIEWIDEYGSIDLFVKDEKGDIIYTRGR